MGTNETRDELLTIQIPTSSWRGIVNGIEKWAGRDSDDIEVLSDYKILSTVTVEQIAEVLIEEMPFVSYCCTANEESSEGHDKNPPCATVVLANEIAELLHKLFTNGDK